MTAAPAAVDADTARTSSGGRSASSAGASRSPGSGSPSASPSGGLLARDVAGTDSAAGLGQTAGVLGAAVIAVPLAGISDRAGRRAGLSLGYAVADPRAPCSP